MNRKRLLSGALHTGVGRLGRLFLRQPSSPWVPVAVYAPIAAGCLVHSLLRESTALWILVAGVLTGVVLWTLVEYLLHAIGFHGPCRSPRLQAFQAALHRGHHDEPQDPNQIVSRLVFTLPVALLFWLTFGALLPSWSLATLPMTGLILGYLWYEVAHFRMHTRPRTGRILRTLTRHHLYHHYKDATCCFGITTPLWDFLFRTGPRPIVPPGSRQQDATPPSRTAS